MLAEIEFLLLCELAELDIFDIDMNNVHETVKGLLEAGRNCELLEKVVWRSNYVHINIKDIKVIDDLKLFVFQDSNNNTYTVFEAKNEVNKSSKECINQFVDIVNSNKSSGKSFVTGLKSGGIYASFVSEQLGIDGIIFGAPSSEKLLGNVKNYIGENDPVGEFLEDVVFVKQNLTDENMNGWESFPYSKSFIFDEEGKAVIGEQTEYSKISSWFYNNINTINGYIWRLFFSSTEDDSFVERDLYYLFMSIDGLSEEGLLKSLERVVVYIESQLEKNIEDIKYKYDKIILDSIEDEEFEDKVKHISELAANNSSQIIKGIYQCVETILKGVSLFTLEKKHINTNTLMNEFAKKIDAILESELDRIDKMLEKGMEDYLEAISVYPDFV